jgi:cytochrome c5
VKKLIALVGLAGAACAAVAAPDNVPLDGRALFEEKCAMCHRDMGMGTGLLQRRMDANIARLENRTDLTSEFVVMAARIGIGNMPRIPRGEASDAELRAIGDYLADSATRAP